MPDARAQGAALLASCLLAAGCGSVNLGDIDETPDAREVKPGPGILDGEDGEAALAWELKKSEDAAAAVEFSPTGPAERSERDEKAEFEQFKIWNDLRTNRRESHEYHEFRQWLEYQKFKQSQ